MKKNMDKTSSKSKKKIKKKKPNYYMYISFFCVFLGLLIMSYPYMSNFFVSTMQRLQQNEIANSFINLTDEERKAQILAAQKENERLQKTGNRLEDFLSKSSSEVHSDVYGTKQGNLITMGTVAIPKINCQISIYEGTSDEILEYGAGHLFQSSLPIGGPNTHTVLTAHSGLMGVEYFTRLTELEKHDYFFIKNLSEVLAYEVQEKHVVLPKEVDKLRIVKDQDLATLVTCTPVGINSHRLLVTGKRVPYEQVASLYEVYERRNEKIDKVFLFVMSNLRLLVFSALAFLLLLILLIVWLFRRRRKKLLLLLAKEEEEEEEVDKNLEEKHQVDEKNEASIEAISKIDN